MPRKKIAIDMDQLRAVCQPGVTCKQVAEALGLCDRTLRSRRKQSAEIEAIVSQGRAKLISDAAGVLARAVRADDREAAKFVLRTLGGWAYATRVEVTGKDGAPVKTEVSGTVEVLARAEKYRAILESDGVPAPTPEAVGIKQAVTEAEKDA